MRTLGKAGVLLLLLVALAGCSTSTSPLGPNEIEIKPGTAPIIDGQLGQDEWADATTLTVAVDANWPVKVMYKHDEANFYFAFSNLKTKAGERYPEVLLDLSTVGGSKEFWWLHASYNDCEGQGKVNEWSSCKPTKTGWEANNFPLAEGGAIEIKISYDKIGLKPGKGKVMGIAFNLTDTKAANGLWPDKAVLVTPTTWGKAHVK